MRKCVLYRDFVNMYNEKGQKVKNLVLVKLTRNDRNTLDVVKLHNFCTDSKSGCDAFYVADVFDHHLKPEAQGGSGEFDNIDHITLCGDHGPRFACVETVFNESRFFKKYAKCLDLKFLCSYHAYNRCDGAGVAVKKNALAAARDNCGPISADDYATLMNKSNNSDTFSYTFPTINRGADVFPKDLTKLPGVKTFCEFVFTHADEKGGFNSHTTGVVRARLVPGVGEYTLFDLVKRPTGWGKRCIYCSHAYQRATYHKKDNTICAPGAKAQELAFGKLNRRQHLSQPDNSRIKGVQISRKRKDAPMAPKTRVIDIKTALLALNVAASKFAGMQKQDLLELLEVKRAGGVKEVVSLHV